MPKNPLNAGFGIGGGFGRGQRRTLRQTASAGGDLNQLFLDRPGISKKLMGLDDNQRNQLASTLGVDPSMLIPKTPEAPPGTSVATPPNPVEPAQGKPPVPLTADALQKQAGVFASPNDPAMGAWQNYLSGAVSRLNNTPLPSFQDLFGTYRDVANQEANRQAGEINASFGSRGGRYGSDLLRAQSALRQKQTTDLASKAQEYQTVLNQLGTQRESGLGNLALQGQQLGEQRYQNALASLYADLQRRSQPPPLFGTSANYAGGFGSPNQVVT